MITRLLLLLTLIVLSNRDMFALAQAKSDLPSDTLARVGSSAVTARDLIERIELMPWIGKDRPAEHDTSKVRALQSLVAERLLAIEASVQGLGNDTLSRWRREILERLLVRDALYNREIKEKVKITAQDFSAGSQRFARELSLLVIGTSSEDASKIVVRALRNTRRPDSTLDAFPRSTVIRWDTVAISLGSIEPILEDVAYRLSDSSRVSPPVRVPGYGWFVLYYLGARTNPEFQRRTLTERRSFIENKIRLQKEAELTGVFTGKLLGPQRAEANQEMFEIVASNALAIFTNSPPPTGTQGYRFSMVVDTLTFLLRSQLGRPFITLPDGHMALGEVLEAFRTNDIPIPSLEPERFRRALNAGIKRIVEGELIARDGYRRNLQETEAVRHDLATWSNYWLSQELRSKVLRQVVINDSSLFAYCVSHAHILGNDFLVNVREVLTDSLMSALRCMEQLEAGIELTALAREKSRRTAWALRGGESGYFRVADMPELGFRALLADTGMVVGPYKLSEGYSVFKVLGKKRKDGTPVSGVDTLMATVRRAAQTVQEQREMNRYVSSLARKYGVQMDYRRLAKVNIVRSNMVTRRFMGFGGSMTAFPMVFPQWEWVKEIDAKEGIVP